MKPNQILNAAQLETLVGGKIAVTASYTYGGGSISVTWTSK